jgi:glycosyltransferase involved in cell wall biosynthesis
MGLPVMQNSDNCMISICIPAYNNPSSLSVALESICLQKYSNLEIIISDDHSPNSVKPVFDQWSSKFPKFNWRYHYQEKNLGVTQNQAWLLRNASGHLMTFFQHDDYLIDSEFYLNIASHYKVNSNTKLYVANAVIQSPLRNEPINKRIFPLDSKNQNFKVYKPLKFLRYFAPTIYRASLPISWTSLVFEVKSAQEVGAFSEQYLTDVRNSIELNTFVDEEAGVFLSLLNDRFAVAFSKKLVSYRSILDTSFSQPQNNPGALLVNANNIEVFNLLKASQLVTNSTTRFRLLFRAISIGLNTDNKRVREFLGADLKDRMLIKFCLWSGKYFTRPLSPLLLKKARLSRLLYLVRKHPDYLQNRIIDRFHKSTLPNGTNLGS